MRYTILILLLVSVALFGCVSTTPEETGTIDEEVEQPSIAAPKPIVTITSPAEGEMIGVMGDAGDVTLAISTRNLVISLPGAEKQEGEGYFVVTLDDEQQSITSKLHTMSDVAVGEHTLQVEIVYSDGSSYSPRIYDDVVFTLESEGPIGYVPRTHEVTINDFDYSPSEITIQATDSIIFTNEGSYPRSATCFIGGNQIFDTGVLATGESATVTLNEVIECEYYSTTHRAMTGIVSVQSNE